MSKRNPFGEAPEDSNVMDDMYGAVGGLTVNSQRIVAKPVDIMSIWPDVTQPRRIMPGDVRGNWDGNPVQVPDLLRRWWQSQEIEMHFIAIINGSEGLGDAPDGNFKALLQLAADIHDTQLNQPPGVVKRGDRYRLVYGERRWLAYHLLRLADETDKYERMPVRVIEATDWEIAKAQATENTARVDLNAIQKARQFAKLLMTARADDYSYAPYDAFGHDRHYYAQVSDGNEHRIPRGFGAKFEQALNISTGQMRKYRMLLSPTGDDSINDWLWQIADDENWAEGFIRSIGELSVDRILRIITEHRGSEQAFRNAIEGAKQVKAEPYRSNWNGMAERAEQQADDVSLRRKGVIENDAPANPPSSSPHFVGGGQKQREPDAYRQPRREPEPEMDGSTWANEAMTNRPANMPSPDDPPAPRNDGVLGDTLIMMDRRHLSLIAQIAQDRGLVLEADMILGSMGWTIEGIQASSAEQMADYADAYTDEFRRVLDAIYAIYESMMEEAISRTGSML